MDTYIIYKISIKSYIYIGSTKDFKQRKQSHKQSCNNADGRDYNIFLYKTIREAGGWDNCEIIPIEECKCETKIQALIREEYWRREYNANLNKNKTYQTEEDKKDYCAEWHRKKNIKQQHIACNCGSVFAENYKAQHEKTKKHQDYLAKTK